MDGGVFALPIVLFAIGLIIVMLCFCLRRRNQSGSFFRVAQPATVTMPATTLHGQPAAYPHPTQPGYPHPTQPGYTHYTQPGYPSGPQVHPPPAQPYSGYQPAVQPSPQGIPPASSDLPPSYDSVVGAGSQAKQQPYNPSFQ